MLFIENRIQHSRCTDTQEHRRRCDCNSRGTHGGTYYKSPAV